MPFKIPAIHSILFATRPSLIALTIGIPPATAASYDRFTLCLVAKLTNSSPCIAIKALFAVTTCLLFFMASSTKSLDIPVPPINSTTI